MSVDTFNTLTDIVVVVALVTRAEELCNDIHAHIASFIFLDDEYIRRRRCDLLNCATKSTSLVNGDQHGQNSNFILNALTTFIMKHVPFAQLRAGLCSHIPSTTITVDDHIFGSETFWFYFPRAGGAMIHYDMADGFFVVDGRSGV